MVQSGPEVEVIVVDDGSTDNTVQIARKYCERYPDIVRLVQKENGGHGSAVNSGLRAATGLFFKVVDSDDWLDIPSLNKVLDTLRANNTLDLVVANYVYEYYYNGTRNIVRYRNVFPINEIISWDKMRRCHLSQMIIMHSLIYRTALLRECGLKLPEHTFYVDNLVAYLPLPYVKKLIYIDCDLYRYFIGREDQSVNTSVMVKRIDQQLKVTRIMVDAYNLFDDIKSQNLRNYMLHYLSMMVSICVIHLNISDYEDASEKVDALWKYIRERDKKLYILIRRSFVNICISLANKTGKRVSRRGLKIAKRIYKFS